MTHVIDQLLQNIETVQEVKADTEYLFTKAKRLDEKSRWWNFVFGSSSSQDVIGEEDQNIDKKISNVEQGVNENSSFWSWLMDKVSVGSTSAAIAADDYLRSRSE